MQERASVERRLETVESLSPERPGFRSLTQANHPYLALREIEAEKSRLPKDLLSEAGVVLMLGDAPGEEALARRIGDAAGIGVRLEGPEWRGAGESGESGSLPEGAVSGWLSSRQDELSPDGGVWSGPLDRLLDVWTRAAGYEWRYDAETETVEVVRSETRAFSVHALVGEQKYNVRTATRGGGGDETSGKASQTISSKLTYDPWKEIAEHAAAAAGDEATVWISQTAATVTVSGLPRAIERVRRYLQHVNKHVLRPVTLSVHLYSVRFARDADYEVGLSSLLPGLFGSNFQLGIESGSISVVKPAAAGGSTLQATVNALRTIGTTSRNLSVDVPALHAQPVQFYDLYDQNYLKEVSSSVEDGVRSYQLKADTVSSGFGLSFVAQIIGQDRVLARITATIQDRPTFTTFGPADNAIQLPEGGRRAIVVTQRIGKGETLVLTGFRDRSSAGSRSGTFDPDLPFPGGGADSSVARVETALLVTASIGEPLGISERRVGSGFAQAPAPVEASASSAAGAGAGG